MGPRLFSRGNKPNKRIWVVIDDTLQWGHDFSAVEIELKQDLTYRPRELQWGHDFSAVEIAVIFRPLQMSKN